MPRVVRRPSCGAERPERGADAAHGAPALAPPGELSPAVYDPPYVTCQLCGRLFKLGHYASHANQYH